MKAAIFHAPKNVSTETVDKPSIKSTDILIKVRSCCICGSDLILSSMNSFVIMAWELANRSNRE